MKNIKKMLIDASVNQEIHDLSKSIINKVDVSKVKKAPTTVVVKKNRSFGIFYKLGVVALGAAGLILIGISIGKGTISTNNPNGNQNQLIPSGNIDSGIGGSDINEPFNPEFMEYSYEYLNNMETQETYNLVNIASTLDKYTFGPVELGETKALTVSQEKALVNDLSCYLYNIEDMLGLKDKVTCEKALVNNNPDYADYKNDIKVIIPNASEYHYYMNETVISEKQSGDVTYKTNTSYNGVIVYGSNEFEINGTMNYSQSPKNDKSSTFKYITNIKIDANKYVLVTEEFKTTENSKENSFNYEYHFGDDVRIINVNQKFADDGSTKSVSFYNGSNSGWYTQIGSIKHTDNHYLECSIKKYDGEYLYVDLNNGVYTYSFKNSKNIY